MRADPATTADNGQDSGAFLGLFGDKRKLVIYSMMYAPQRTAPCPMCTSFLNARNGIAVNLRQRIAVAVTAGSPIKRPMRGYLDRILGSRPGIPVDPLLLGGAILNSR